MFNKFIYFLKNKVNVCLIILILLLITFYMLNWINLDNWYIFCYVSFVLFFYSWFIQHHSIIINQFIKLKSKDEIYDWLCFYLTLNLYKNIILCILFKFDKFYFSFNDNKWIDILLDFIVYVFRHVILIHVLYIIFYYYYGMLYDLTKYNNIYKYLIFFSILIFTDLYSVLFIILNSIEFVYLFLLSLGIFYDFIKYIMFFIYYKWFKIVYNIKIAYDFDNDNPSIYMIYKYRTLSTFTGLVTLSLYENYKLIVDKDKLLDFNKLYFNNIIILYGNIDIVKVNDKNEK